MFGTVERRPDNSHRLVVTWSDASGIHRRTQIHTGDVRSAKLALDNLVADTERELEKEP